ncbi:MAG TPA: hypothetical protein VE291_00185 [Terracidiphilus sp.]|nr:hypothetical protein [Terracidiphilus sp.]
MAVCAAAVAAAQGDTAHAMKPVPPPVLPAPFTVEAAHARTPLAVELRPADAMTKADRMLMADAESSIAERAGVSGFALQDGAWTATQIVCPALPHHLLLRYTRNNGVGDGSEFSASIPRGGDGRVRIIPIRRRGYSLFSPAPINALTISAFNHIRAEEPEAARAENWLGNGLCYAALAGGQPRVPPADATPALGKPVPAVTAVLAVNHGGEVIRFADEGAKPRPMLWTMEFTRGGKLTKATRTAVQLYGEKPVPLTSATSAPKPVPSEQSNRY